MNQSIFEDIVKIFKEKLEDNNLYIIPQTVINEVCSSAILIEVVLYIEIKYNLQILMADFSAARTIKDLVEIIEKQKRNKVRI